MTHLPLSVSKRKAVGFEDQIYFSSMFKKIMGKSPVNYMKEVAGKNDD